MKTRMLAVAGTVTMLLAALPCAAQPKTLPDLEQVEPRKPVKEPIQPPKEVLPLPIVEEKCPTGIRVLWWDCDEPLTSLWPREEITMVKQPTFEIAYKYEDRVICDIVVKPRVVKKALLCTCMKEVKVTDPVTGECSIVTQPVTEEQIIEETVYTAVREEHTVKVGIPYLKKVDVLVPRKDLLLEYRTEMVKKPHPVAIPDLIPEPRAFIVPEPPPAPEACVTPHVAPEACLPPLPPDAVPAK